MGDNISNRKSEHLQVVVGHQVGHCTGPLLDDVKLIHQALPELSLDEIKTDCSFFGKTLSAPFMILSMTGGADSAKEMNRSLARLAAETGIAFAVGSQRVLFRNPGVLKDFAVRPFIPDGVLLGNIGAVQLLEEPMDKVAGLVDSIDADGLCVHLNAAQELVQEEGNRSFKGIMEAIARLNDRLEGRLLVKETGAGLSPRALRQLKALGIEYIDVAGAGGTSWTKVESLRASNEAYRHLGEGLSDWGVPTAFSIWAAKRIFANHSTIIASGGVYSGLDAVKAFALGADMVGFARPILLEFVKNGFDGAHSWLMHFFLEFRALMLLTGASDLAALKKIPTVVTGLLRHYVDHYDLFDGERD